MLKSFVRDIAGYAPSQFLPAFTAFITTPILTGLLLPAEYGYWALASSASAFLVAISVSGYGSVAIRFYPVYKAKATARVFFGTLIVSVSVVVASIAGLSLALLALTAHHMPSPFVRIVPLVILISIAQSMFVVFVSVIRAQGRSEVYTVFQLFISYGGLGIGLFSIMVLSLGVEGLLWGTLLAFVLALPPLIYLAIREEGIHPNAFRISDAVDMWRYAWPLAVGSVAMWGLRLSDLYIIRMSWPERDVGIYSVSYNISAKSIELLVTLFILSVSPLVMSTWENEGRMAAEEAVQMVTRVYLVLCLPAAIGLTVLAYPFVALLTAPEYQEGYKIVGLVVFSSFTWGLANIAMLGIAIKKQSRRLGTNQIIAASTHIGLALLLVPRFGYQAAAVTTLLGYAVLLTLQTLSSRKYLIWHFPFTTLRNVFVASAIMGIVAWGIHRSSGVVHGVSTLYLCLGIAGAVPTYFACLWLLGEVGPREKDLVMQILYKAKRRAA